MAAEKTAEPKDHDLGFDAVDLIGAWRNLPVFGYFDENDQGSRYRSAVFRLGQRSAGEGNGGRRSAQDDRGRVLGVYPVRSSEMKVPHRVGLSYVWLESLSVCIPRNPDG